MKKALFSFLSLILLSGCGSLYSINQVDPAQRAALITVVARTATSVGFAAGFDEDEVTRRQDAAHLIFFAIDHIREKMAADLDGIEVIDLRSILELFKYTGLDLPPEVEISLVGVIEMVLSYVRVDMPDAFLTDKERLYIDAFLDGVQKGVAPFVGNLTP